MIDRNIIYYPVHLTPGYESATNASKFQSDVSFIHSLFTQYLFIVKTVYP